MRRGNNYREPLNETSTIAKRPKCDGRTMKTTAAINTTVKDDLLTMQASREESSADPQTMSNFSGQPEKHEQAGSSRQIKYRGYP
ncbi:unnamed protein product [Schistocephalus solidus]|uniref:Uncharacterized protein n=1 Tax=Schistocephalus solidus TaxID=70667 RepID=A0A183SLV7_SCHSO|nr:unnamed protein product [Schistocephalus solidus]